MEKNILRKKMLAILMILSLIAADFSILSSNLLTYADQIRTETNNKNVDFLAYFKNDQNQVVNSIQKSIKSEELKLYAKIIIRDGYINEGASIEIQDSNFNLKNNILSPYIQEIKGNQVILKQIDVGETEIALDIEPIKLDRIDKDMLTKISLVKLNGSYTGSTNGGIQYGKDVCISFTADESAIAELVPEVITNKVLEVNGTDKRIIQLLIKSRLEENHYPVEKTTLKLNVPKLSELTPETIDVLAINKNTNITNKTNKNGTLEIVLENKADENGKIDWSKNVYNELIATFMYDPNVNVNDLLFTINSTIKTYNSNKNILGGPVDVTAKDGLNNSIMAIPKITTEDIYKGKLYEQTELQYNTNTTIVITNANLSKEVEINEGIDKFVLLNNATVSADTKYISTTLNSNQALEILGTEGSIEIKNGNITTTINKAYIDANDGENIIIQHSGESTNKLEIKIINPAKAGILEMNHTKAIVGTYTVNQIQTIAGIKTFNSAKGTDSIGSPIDASVDIEETISKAELKIENNKQVLSTTEENELILGITLLTGSEQYNLYKNPTITIEMPSAVENINLSSIEKFYDDKGEFGVPSVKIVGKQIKITLNGEQDAYPSTSLYLQLKLNVTLAELATTKTDKIMMTYTNEKTNQQVKNAVEQSIEISGKPGLLKIFNVESDNNKSLTDALNKVVSSTYAGDEVALQVGLINNTEADINNVKIIGKLPTTGNTVTGKEENSLQTTLSKIIAEGATVYYTENVNATVDSENDWTTTFTTNAKLYLLEIDSLPQENEFYANITIKLPNSLPADALSYTQYEVIYNETNTTEMSRPIALATSTLSGVNITLTAEVGEDTLTNGDVIKEGEVVKYIAKVANNTGMALENVALKIDVPDETTLVKPVESYMLKDGVEVDNVYLLDTYYEEITNKEEIISKTIKKLSAGQTETIEFEARVKTDITSGTEVSSKAVVTYNNETKQSEEIKNILEEANIKVTIKKAIDSSIRLTSGSEVQYNLIIENLSAETINGIGVEIISDEFTLDNKDIIIPEISANKTFSCKLKGKINNDAENVKISATITNGTTEYRSNTVTENLVKADATISLTSPQDNANLKTGDIIEYNIVIKNTGETSEYFKVYYMVAEELTVQSVQVNGTTNSATSGNLIYEGMSLNAGKSGTIKITAKVNDVTETTAINNNAKVEVLNVYKDISQDVVHTLVKSDDSGETTDPDDPTNPDDPTDPNDPTKPDDPADPGDNTKPDDPTEPDNNTKPDDSTGSDDNTDNDSETTVVKNIITGYAWFDENRDGRKDTSETVLSGIKVKIYNVSTKNYLKDENGNVREIQTNDKGKYTISDVEKGSYILIFEYDSEKYEPTTYFADGVEETLNSKVLLKKLDINGQEVIAAVTDTINVQSNVLNVNIGLKEKLKFDLELSKFINRIVVQTNKETKAYDYENSTFEKVEIHRKQIEGALVVLEYNIKVRNSGDVAGYVKNIVDYLPKGLTFSSELNTDWYLSGECLYTKSLENVEIQPGEEKEIKLILTKTMTSENTGVINNKAEIYQDYNKYGEADIDSTINNQVQSEDDHGVADVIVLVATGGNIITYIILVMVNIVLISAAIVLMVKNNIIQISTKEERR